MLKPRNLPIFRYNLEPNYSFVGYVSNIGGIFSLWFGLAFIDLSFAMKIIIRYLNIYYRRYFMTHYLLEALKKTLVFALFSKIFEFVGQLLYRLEFYNWRLWLKIICIPCLLYQIFEITQIYLNFSTNVNVELIPIMDKNLISLQRIPAITICHENYLRDIFFNNNSKSNDRMVRAISFVLFRYYNKRIDKDLNLEIKTKIRLNNSQKVLLFFYETKFKEEFREKYKQILEFMIKYLENDNYDNSFIINNSSLFDEMQFYSNQFKCYLGINQSLNSNQIYKMESSISYLGKCNTYLLKSSDNFSFNSEIQSRNGNILIEFFRSQFSVLDFLVTVFYIHSSDSMPSLSYNDRLQVEANNQHWLFSEYFFKKLEPPYDTNCRKYVNKTRADCLNHCFIKFKNSSKNCINDEQFLITFRINRNGLEPNISFKTCDQNARKEGNSVNLHVNCSKECPVSCEEQIFTFENIIFSFFNLNYTFDFYENYYTSINYSPNMLFMEYIIKVANLLSLWHGIDFTSIRDQIFELFALFLTKTKILNIFNVILHLLMSFEKIRIFVMVLMKAYLLIVGNSKV